MKLRVISSIIGIALLAAVLWLHKTVVFPIALAAVGVLMSYELLKSQKAECEYIYLFVSLIYCSACAILTRIFPKVSILGLCALYIIATFAYIVISQCYLLFRHDELPVKNHYVCLGYNILIGLCLMSLSIIENKDGNLGVFDLITVFCAAWVADSGAYFAGTVFGKHKLCPEISPKKTVEGLIGGILADAVAFFVIAIIRNRFIGSYINPLWMVAIGIVCSLLGVLGDLTASLIKRDAGIKDFSNLMPGHGGALDRFDSVIYIAPFMMAAIEFSQAVA